MAVSRIAELSHRLFSRRLAVSLRTPTRSQTLLLGFMKFTYRCIPSFKPAANRQLAVNRIVE